MKFVLHLLLCFSFQIALSQEVKKEDWTLFPEQENKKETTNSESRFAKKNDLVTNQKVTLIQDARLEALIEKEIRINEKNQKIKGYRIQIFSGSGTDSRNLALATQADFLQKFEGLPSYLVFQAPNFKIRVGDFRTKIEAEQALADIKQYFGNGFIVKDEIKLPKLK